MRQVAGGGAGRGTIGAGVAAGLAAVLVAGCSGNGGGTPAATGTPAAPATTASVAPPPPTAATTPAGAGTTTGTATPTATATGPNGVEELSAEQVLARARQAGQQAGSVHLVGDLAQGSRTVAVDVRMRQDGAAGTVRSAAGPVELVALGEDVYVKGDDAFYRQLGGDLAAQVLRGKWVKVSANEQLLRQAGALVGVDTPAGSAGLTGLVDLDGFLDTALQPRGSVRKGSPTMVEGTRALPLDLGQGARVYVALDGEPYPVRLEAARQGSGAAARLAMREWGQPVQVSAPDPGQVLDAGLLRR